VVKTSASFASLHIGRLYERQNCLLQSLQVAFLAVDSPGSSVKGMIVLLLKHVHLQKDVAAGRTGLVFILGKSGTSLQAHNAGATRASHRNRSCSRCFMLMFCVYISQDEHL
jgi:hypothetical protein